MIAAEALRRLAERAGIGRGYHDIWGAYHETDATTALALLAAMDLARGEDDAAAGLARLDDAAFGRTLPPVAVFDVAAAPYGFPIAVPVAEAHRELRWTLDLATGERWDAPLVPAALEPDGERVVAGIARRRYRFQWRDRLPVGVHRFSLLDRDGEVLGTMALAIAPSRCHQPDALLAGERAWGLSVQLYSVRSQRNWGLGDFTDLAHVVEIAAGLGADAVGLNPLHALFPDQPDRSSPYSPSSRLFLDVLYLDVEALPEFAECDEVRGIVHGETFQTRLAALRRSELVNYPGVARAKLDVLAKLYAHFRARHVAGRTDHAQAFEAFAAERGEALQQFALFHALEAHFRAESPTPHGPVAWPDDYRDPSSGAVAAFARAHEAEVDYHAWLQWHCERQLARAAARARELGMSIGLYLDLAVSVAPDGADAWRWRDSFALGVGVGAPPDDFNPKGQDWGLPPFDPFRLREDAYRPFRETLAANMRHAGALRIDHVMSLMRLYWVPAGASPADGAYVHYPLADLASILALESVANRCLVIGEDLGTVPDEVRAVLARLGILSYRLLYFEQDDEARFKRPSAYPADALVAATTHDLPTLAGWWVAHDLALRERLNLFPTAALRARQIAARPRERVELLAALAREGLLPDAAADPARVPPMTPELAAAIEVFLARTPAKLVMVQPEDVFGQREQANLPGTTHEHPNWCRKLDVPLERWRAHPTLASLAERLFEERGAISRRDAEPAAP
ncbi:MAG: 4-alpha-glucanotransferase [Burkholderiales bacterium]|jgi:(1->4)-alpha-D-glucan 1-alpha-D-glucosylmutase|nr:4-alpha-glucanotransferase [Burkholderiales bacterium]